MWHILHLQLPPRQRAWDNLVCAEHAAKRNINPVRSTVITNAKLVPSDEIGFTVDSWRSKPAHDCICATLVRRRHFFSMNTSVEAREVDLGQAVGKLAVVDWCVCVDSQKDLLTI